jgi:phospholipid/cholesterol/gamma-HCH transport system ATP-binding protein
LVAAAANLETSAEAPAPLISVRDLSVQFGGQTVLRDVNLDIQRGETVSILGESGCGKTVLLKTLVGLIQPTHGTVLFDGRSIHELPAKELTRQRLRFGFVFQGAALFDSMDVFENVAFPIRQHSRPKQAELLEKIKSRLLEVGLGPEVLPKKPAEISGGMRKRVGIARAGMLDPEVMLYDEPTTGLDPIMSDVINELVLRIRRARPVTSVLVTHDMHTTRKVSSRVVMLYPRSRLKPSENQVLFDGPPDAMDACPDSRVAQFVRGEAGERLSELERGE